MNIAFTGHRPSKLGGYNWNTKSNQLLMLKIIQEIENIKITNDESELHFITGGAIGVDQMAFYICNKLKEKHKSDEITRTTELAIPFLHQDIKWFGNDRNRYNEQKLQADIVTYVDKLDDYKIKGYQEDVYYPAKMQQRNKYMVDNCDLLIAVWDGSKVGTANCVNYAKKLGKKIIIINPKEVM